MEPCPDVIADTSWLWNQDMFLKNLRTEDVVIVLDRDAAQRTASVNKLLGPHDWTDLEDKWQSFKAKLALVPDTVWLDYKELFTSTGKEKIFQLLWYRTGAATGNFENMFQLLKHMRITNKWAEEAVKGSYGLGEQDGK